MGKSFLILAIFTVSCAAGSVPLETNTHPIVTAPAAAPTPAPAPVTVPPTDGNTPANTTSVPPSIYGGDTRCSGLHGVFCESFETPAPGNQPDPNLWKVVTVDANNTVEVSTTRAARGAHALHVHSPVVGSIGATIRTTRGFPAPNNTLYGRLFMYVDAQQAPGGHNTVVRALGEASNGTNNEQFGSMFHNWVANWGGPGADNGGYSKTGMPVKQWVCVEWAHKGDAAELDVWADGVSIFVMTNNWLQGNTMLQGPMIAYNELDIGWEVYEHFDDDLNTGSYDVYIDEIAVDYARIGCDR